MCHSPSSVFFSVPLLHLKFTGRHGERWMDSKREKAAEMEECVAAHSRAKSTLTAFLTERLLMSASSSLSLDFCPFLHSSVSFTLSFPVRLFLPCPPDGSL